MTNIVYRKPIARGWSFAIQFHGLFGSYVGFEKELSEYSPFKYKLVRLRLPTPSIFLIDLCRLVFGGPRRWFSKWAVKKKDGLAYYGCVKAFSLRPIIVVFIVEKKSKAFANIYLGNSWVFRGKSIGRTWKVVRPWPYFDFTASLHIKYHSY